MGKFSLLCVADKAGHHIPVFSNLYAATLQFSVSTPKFDTSFCSVIVTSDNCFCVWYVHAAS